MSICRGTAVVLLVLASLAGCAPERRPDDPSDDASDGGACTPHCDGKECGSDGCGGTCGTCVTGASCTAGTCVRPKTCENAQRDPGETDVDCGGPCLPCAVGQLCAVHRDCLSASCQLGRCAQPTCSDRLKNQGESDVDCGQVCARGCADGRTCAGDPDCASHQCAAGVCVSCSDGVKDGRESDVDCGGTCSTKCADGRACAVNADCSSNRCTGGRCAGCHDGVKNGGESDLDCGAVCGVGCADGRTCAFDADCASRDCVSGRCVSCFDGVRDGAESDVDCGSACSVGCAVGRSCRQAADCTTGNCEQGRCAAAATCTDGRKNGTETDVDCGGSCGATCDAGKSCTVNADCRSGVCEASRCFAWTVETISGTEQVGGVVAAAFDPGGTLTVAYNELTAGGQLLRLARRSGSSWTSTVSDLNGGDDLSIDVLSMDVDLGGRATVGMLRRGMRAASGTGATSVDAAVETATGFTLTPLVPQVSGGGCSNPAQLAVARDPAGILHIAHLSSGTLSYATEAGTGFMTQTFPNFPPCVMDVSLAFTPQGAPLLALVSWENSTYALRVHRLENGQWTNEATGRLGHYGVVSLAVDGTGAAQLAYVDEGTQRLTLAWKSGTTWATQTIDSQAAAMSVSLARDAAGVLHVAYSDRYTMRLRYARQGASGWNVRAVGNATTYVPKVAVDPAGAPWIVWRDFSTNKLTAAH